MVFEDFGGAGTAPDDDDDDTDRCPSSPDGRHEPDEDTVAAATGYDPAVEGGIVLEFRCRLCGAVGSGLLREDQYLW